MQEQEWEYGQLTAYVRGRFFGLGVKTEINWNGHELSRDVPIYEHLNRYGRDGWELVSSYATAGPGAPEIVIAYVFKRPVIRKSLEEQRQEQQRLKRIEEYQKELHTGSIG